MKPKKDKIERRVYVVIGKYGVDCFSNLSKLIREYSLFTYHPVYDRLRKTKEYTTTDYTIIQTILR